LNYLQIYLGLSSLLPSWRPIQRELSPSAGQITVQHFSHFDPSVICTEIRRQNWLAWAILSWPPCGGGPRRCWALSAVQDHRRCTQSSCAVVLECIRLYMGSIVTAVTASRVWKFISSEGCCWHGAFGKHRKGYPSCKMFTLGSCCFSGLGVLLRAGTAQSQKCVWAGEYH